MALTDEQLAQLEAMDAEFKKDKAGVLKQLKEKGPSIHQGVFKQGYGRGEKETAEKAKASGEDPADLKAQLDDANAKLEQAQKELKDKAPDVATLKTEHATKLRDLKDAQKKELQDRDAKISQLQNQGTTDKLIGLLHTKHGIHPRIGKGLVAEHGTRIKPSADGKGVQFVDEDGAPYGGKTADDQMNALAESLADTVEPELRTARSSNGQGGGGARDTDPAPGTGTYDAAAEGKRRGEQQAKSKQGGNDAALR
jgi:hypothetical protein